MSAAAPAPSELPQLHELIQDAVQAAEYRQLVDLLRHLLQRLQFLQTHKDRVVLDQLGGVERRTGRVRLFTAANDVGLRRLLRLHHAVEDLLHLAGQNHVLDADTQYFDAQFTNATAHVGKDIVVQRLGTHHLAKAVLQFSVQIIAVLRDLGTHRHRIDDTDARGQVYPQADLILCQQFLARHLDGPHSQFDNLSTHVLLEVPEGVGTRLELSYQLAIDEQQSRRLRRHRHRQRRRLQHAELPQALAHRFRYLQAVAQRHLIDGHGHQALPVQLAHTRRQHILELTALRHETDLLDTDIGQHKAELQLDAQALDQCIHVLTDEVRARN